jgi:hypothetical protein
MNCKPGDLAYLSSECVDEGVIVEVLSAVVRAPGELPAWNCRSKTPIRCTWEIKRTDCMATEVAIEDRYLRPISGVPVHEEQSETASRPAFVVPARYFDIVEPA